ncbi:hypothetical protein N7448_009345 [Penicillium atrosanguineum]|uniref:Uncharacterized protein n=1 Tax=Penicillium atrosanguineum TaxID=1132637 RepID=A0A9W9PZZ2_9EURO|nr:uncharacterized protein N7443_006595 [Penicillium atrosanguineum]KAJ5123248.1 hypothetical protein N7448_009345 [Penicillium atrosanguineum]KAJ5141878.1 hypothetical protein N7526_002873 [Penicillium atrosanguineum]KAJ5298475.1 hypothetical protein N7443_006595 [Penicillium atrosanguineum]KAJ5321259.1 hypothetical protein N7476_004261 [Penicillium atrosanguineum]
MSFLTSIRAGSRRAMQTSYTIPSTSAFHTSAVQRTLKESDKNRDDLPNIYETEKERQLKNSKEGKAAWHSDLASDSEAQVKADRGETGEEDKSFEEMQEKTKHMPNRK